MSGAACAESEPVDGGRGQEHRRDIVSTEKKLYSQHKEELVIRDYFQDRKNGVFLDVGSSRPIKDSTTYYLEKHLGWTGVAVDALAEFADDYKSKRSGTQFFGYIVTDHSGTTETFYRVVGVPELSSVTKDRVVLGKQVETRELTVPTTTLNDLLDKVGIDKIDFLSMDIEGGAPKALAGFDIAKYKPELICIESGGSNKEYNAGLVKYFADRGYQRIGRYMRHDWVNWYFHPTSSDPYWDFKPRGEDLLPTPAAP